MPDAPLDAPLVNTNVEGCVPDGRPWSGHAPGPRKRLVWRSLRPATSQHHALDPEDRAPFFAPLGRGGAILEPVPTALYDSFEIGPKGIRSTGAPDANIADAWAMAHGYMMRLLVDPTGKTADEMAPFICAGGLLPRPRMFDLRRFSLVFQPLLQWFEIGPGLVTAPYADEGVLTAQLRADIAAIKAEGHFRFQLGVRDYACVPLSFLPQPTGIMLPSEFSFFAEVRFTVLPALRYTWRVFVRGEGFLGMELT